ncbi:related to GAL10 - UDP-glucose 4-epimerase [Cephalotrichum gorgonifer]|uniref:Related to GAL10 - UDP-glucose 4-epimerase n=1 Tax=Cephalotrichum gorgonifer TaxID=2041049 RepID=A0AAE8SVZ2_9PEZI|nr:related to GAL10 - UDP-glucose 4-epimerase [Cephalotrichum gorgonifer]
MSSEAPITLLPLGAILQSLTISGVNIVQGFPTQADYEAHNAPHFGESIGRVANRISGAKINALNGSSYPLAANNGVNSLHGGNVGWGNRVWEGPTPTGLRKIEGVEGAEGESVEFKILSEDGDEGFPGTVEAKAIYTAAKVVEDGKEVTVLEIEYSAELLSGADETAINMTNHSYFNLSGDPTIEGTVVTLTTNTYLPVDAGGIPTAGPAPFAAVSANTPFTLGAVSPDIDDCFIVNTDPASVPVDTRSLPLSLHVAANHPKTGIHLEVSSTEPAFQFYTGRYIDVPAVEGAPARGVRAGFCVEPSRYVNAINEPEWRDMMILKKGEKYGCRIVYKAWKA